MNTEQYCHVGNTAKQCRLGLFQDSDFAGDLEDSKSTIRWNIVHFRKAIRLFQSVGCVRNTLQISHSSTESEIISLDAGLRFDGIPALASWDLIVAVLHGNTYQKDQERGDPSKSPTRKKFHGMIDDLDNVDFVSSNVHSSHQEALLYVFERQRSSDQDDQKGKKHSQRDMFPEPTELLLIGCLMESIWTHPRSKSNTVDTKNQLADKLTKGNFTSDAWNHLLCLFNVSQFQFHQLS